MIDIGPIPAGWVFQPVYAGADGGVAYELGTSLVVVQPAPPHGHYVTVQGRSAGVTVAAYEVSKEAPMTKLRQMLAIVGRHCPDVAEWLALEAPCTSRLQPPDAAPASR